MAYNTILANRIREAFEHLPQVEEIEMFKGVCFMVDGKMCVCVNEEEMLCRIAPEEMENALEQNGTRQMVMNGRGSKSYVYVSQDVIQKQTDFDHWIKLALDFNPLAKASRKKR